MLIWKVRKWLANILEKIVFWLRGENRFPDHLVDALRYGFSVKQIKPRGFYKEVK